MDIPELLDAAKRRKGSLKDIAGELGIHPNRLSDWRAGRLKPNASEIAYLAESAGLPILETVADIESQLDGQHASIWKKALGNLRAAGIAATVLLCAALFTMLAPTNAKAADHGSTAFTRQGSQVQSLYHPPELSGVACSIGYAMHSVSATTLAF